MSTRKVIQFLFIIPCWLMLSKAFGHEGSGILFIENKGQWNIEVLFKASVPGGDLYVLKNNNFNNQK